MPESTFPDWCPKQCGWRHWPDKPCPKTKLPMPVREPGMEDGQELGPVKAGRLLAAEGSTVHDVEARCPECGVVRVLQIFAPPAKVVMQRACDPCNGFAPVWPVRERALPYKEAE